MKRLTSIQALVARAREIRTEVIKMVTRAQSGHIAGSLSLADIITALIFNVMQHNPRRPQDPARDRLVLSCGHTCPALYAALAYAGYFPRRELKKLRRFGARLQGHPHRLSLPGIEASTGSLGHGLGIACGMALGLRQTYPRTQVYAILSDGEQDEGSTWEAVMFAGKERLSNLTAIIDRNNIQVSGNTEQVMPLEPLRQKYESFRWHVLEIDGHDISEIITACAEARAIVAAPVVIIAHTIPGKGVPFMEFDCRWHGKAPREAEARRALSALGQ
jgi:transketolase